MKILVTATHEQKNGDCLTDVFEMEVDNWMSDDEIEHQAWCKAQSHIKSTVTFEKQANT